MERSKDGSENRERSHPPPGRRSGAEAGSTTLVQAALVLLLGAGVFAFYSVFKESFSGSASRERCVVNGRGSSGAAVDLADPGLDTEGACD